MSAGVGGVIGFTIDEVSPEIETEPAPSASDVENFEAGPQQQLGGNVPLLGELRVVERSVAVLEISARILQVGIQKQAIDATIDIVVMDRIATRPPGFLERPGVKAIAISSASDSTRSVESGRGF